jgi:competence protein CoiA
MSLLAYRASDKAEIEAFSIDAARWNDMRSEPSGTYLMIGTNWPAVLKCSIRGVQFFAHAPGCATEMPEPESELHLLAKIVIARALRKAGFTVWVERPGTTPNGEPWQADVLCETEDGFIAIEIQLAQQTLADYEARTARYQRSGVKCVWLVRAPQPYSALSKAIYYRACHGNSLPFRPSLSHLAALPLEVGDAKSFSIENVKVVVFPGGRPLRIPLEECALGLVNGELVFTSQEWRWRATGQANGHVGVE